MRKWDLMDSSPRDIEFGFDGSAGRAECTSVGKSFFFCFKFISDDKLLSCLPKAILITFIL